MSSISKLSSLKIRSASEKLTIRGLLIPALLYTGIAHTETIGLEEIIVTAEKRKENVQSIPASISAFTANMLQARGINAPQELQFNTPGLVIAQETVNTPVNVVFIRGVGLENRNAGFGDPGVPIHINGHYTQATAYILRDMLDVERVEVQRGPQGTLYGRNAIGGNINIITKRPTDEFEALLSADIGNFNKRHFQAMASGALSSNLRGRLVISDEERDGFVENLGVGSDKNSSDYTSIRGALEFDVTDAIELYLNTYYFKDTGDRSQLATDEILGDANPTNSDPFTIATNTLDESEDESKGISLDIEWNVGDLVFRSLSAWDKSVTDIRADGDRTAVFSTEGTERADFETFTQEFQLLSSTDNPLKWVVGAFYYDEKASSPRVGIFDPVGSSLAAPNPFLAMFLWDTNGDGTVDENDPFLNQNIQRDTNAESKGIYGQINYFFTEKWELITGLRYSEDKKSARASQIHFNDDGSLLPVQNFFFFTQPAIVGDPTSTIEDNWSEVTGKLGLSYHSSDDLLLYGSFSRGYKSGGIGLPPAGALTTYDPEILDAYEIGMKSQWLDNRIQLNLAAFYYDYQDKQDAQTATPLAAPSITNASAATITGFELEAQAFITEGLLVDISLGYLDTEVDDFMTVDGQFPALGLQDLAGNDLRLSPQWKIHFGAQYEWNLDDYGLLTLRGDYSWTDDQWSNTLNRDGTGDTAGLVGDGDFLRSYKVVNARLNWSNQQGDWSLTLYGKNLTNEEVKTFVFAQTTTNFVSYYDPRTYGLIITKQF